MLVVIFLLGKTVENTSNLIKRFFGSGSGGHHKTFDYACFCMFLFICYIDAYENMSKPDENTSSERLSGRSGQYKPKQYGGGGEGGGGHHKTSDHGPVKTYKAVSPGLVLYIYAMEDRDIERVLSDIKKMSTEKRFDDAKFQAFIEKLSSERVLVRIKCC